MKCHFWFFLDCNIQENPEVIETYLSFSLVLYEISVCSEFDLAFMIESNE